MRTSCLPPFSPVCSKRGGRTGQPNEFCARRNLIRELRLAPPDLGFRRRLDCVRLKRLRTSGAMLNAVQPAQAQPSPSSSSFAGLLASLASPHQPENIAPFWSGSDLGEDVATISYESALRAHARYRPADRSEWEGAENSPADDAKSPVAGMMAGSEGSAAQIGSASRAAHDGDLRRASVTVRLSEAEVDRLRQRAREAGLTISAYLRSCTFEVEALRAQVKAALAELRTAGTEGTQETGNKGTREQGNEVENRRGKRWNPPKPCFECYR